VLSLIKGIASRLRRRTRAIACVTLNLVVSGRPLKVVELRESAEFFRFLNARAA
jgi:hypothetical protein